ncbi:uncharacterized protein M6B38_144770 [Iris pallida]|uniref:Transmembrane protein 214 n=1 Tax=Iris pallida TaxID=29817 RepID=A0AAX6FAM4_IRIPA|nr:uncharacterized protein M6B38_144770 [Iris pallida]
MDPAAAAAADSSASVADPSSSAAGSSHGWQKVTSKRQRRAPPSHPHRAVPTSNGTHVFDSVELKAEERRRAIEAAAAAAADADADATVIPNSAANRSLSSSDDEAEPAVGDAAAATEKKPKEKKPKKPKITVSEAAAKIDPDDLSSFLVDITGSYESQQDIQLMRFADYFGRAFAAVGSSQFPWVKTFKESPVAKIIDVPLCHISDPVYKTSVDWIAKKSAQPLGDFILWCLDSILADLASQQTPAKGSKKPVQQSPSKGQVAIFVVLAMTLRQKPDVLVTLLPKLRDNPKYQGHEKFPVFVWVVGQASQGGLVAGMNAWLQYLLPLISSRANVNPQSRDLALQLVERILSVPKARSILLDGAVRRGERLLPPSALELLMRATFPATQIKATERFLAIYPTLKELALAGSPGTKTTKQASQQLLPSAVKAMQESNLELSKEAADMFIWCLVQNPECYKQWEKLHLDNIEASVAVLRKLSDEWNEYSVKFSPPNALKQTLKNLRAKNEQALSGVVDASNQTAVKEADKYCKVILGKCTRGSSCIRGGVFVLVVAVAVGFAVSPDMHSFDWKKLHSMVSSSLQSF